MDCFSARLWQWQGIKHTQRKQRLTGKKKKKLVLIKLEYYVKAEVKIRTISIRKQDSIKKETCMTISS